MRLVYVKSRSLSTSGIASFTRPWALIDKNRGSKDPFVSAALEALEAGISEPIVPESAQLEHLKKTEQIKQPFELARVRAQNERWGLGNQFKKHPAVDLYQDTLLKIMTTNPAAAFDPEENAKAQAQANAVTMGVYGPDWKKLATTRPMPTSTPPSAATHRGPQLSCMRPARMVVNAKTSSATEYGRDRSDSDQPQLALLMASLMTLQV